MATPARPPKPQGIVSGTRDSETRELRPSTPSASSLPVLDRQFLEGQSREELSDLAGDTELMEALYQSQHPLPAQHAKVMAEIDGQHATMCGRLEKLRQQVVEQKAVVALSLQENQDLQARWEEVEREMYSALKPYSSSNIYMQLQSAVVESEKTSETLLTSFLEQGVGAQNQDVPDFIREYKSLRKTFHLRNERLLRWKDGRISGFR